MPWSALQIKARNVLLIYFYSSENLHFLKLTNQSAVKLYIFLGLFVKYFLEISAHTHISISFITAYIHGFAVQRQVIMQTEFAAQTHLEIIKIV